MTETASDRMAKARAAKAANAALRAQAPEPIRMLVPADKETAGSVDRMVEVTRETLPAEHVLCRVMKRGDDKIFTGETKLLAKDRFPKFKQGAVIVLPEETAALYEDERGWVEIL